jgi:hypothetical protein
VHALHNIHDALTPGGILVDTQPVSDRPAVAADGVTLGTLDMREWLDTIQAVDERLVETISAGLYELQHESRFVVTDTYDKGPECLEIIGSWQGTRVPDSVSTRLAGARRRLQPEGRHRRDGSRGRDRTRVERRDG